MELASPCEALPEKSIRLFEPPLSFIEEYRSSHVFMYFVFGD
jgi:hypothetical protein